MLVRIAGFDFTLQTAGLTKVHAAGAIRCRARLGGLLGECLRVPNLAAA